MERNFFTRIHSGSTLIFARQRLWHILTVLSILFGAAGIARALTVSSGWVGWSPDFYVPGYGMTDVYLYSSTFYNSDFNTVPVQNYGVFYEGPTSLPAGWIGLQVAGYRSGGLCGWDEDYSYESANSWGQIYNLCTNPSGSQTFYTQSAGSVWNGNGYNEWGWQNSPSLLH